MVFALSGLAESSTAPQLAAVFPRQAFAGRTIFLSGLGFTSTRSISFGDIPSPRVEVVGDDLVRTEVPRGVPAQPIDLTITLANGDRTVFPAAFDGSGADEPFEISRGDLISTAIINCHYGPSSSLLICTPTVRWLGSDLRLKMQRVVSFYQKPLFFDQHGVLTLGRDTYDALLGKMGHAIPQTWPAKAVRYDSDGNWTAISEGSWSRYDQAGNPIASGALLLFPNGADLASDKCTLYIANSEGVDVVDICRNQPLPRIYTGLASDVRVLPDASLLVATGNGLTRIRASGEMTFLSCRANIVALSPDGMTAYIAGGQVARYDVLTGTLGDLAGPASDSDQLAIYGEWFAARGPSHYKTTQRRRAM